MAFRAMPMGPVLTIDQFSAAAMDRPLSLWATFAGSSADMALQMPGLGTVLREISLPGLARKPVSVDLGLPTVTGGRGGPQRFTMSKLGYKTAEEVAAEGDKLFETEDEYKASSAYRPAIPFERGMTASRAKALADQYDVSQVRQFYASKRPVTAFLGAVAGSALDPINYIPIIGPAARVAAVARMGRIAGYAAVGSADAALNSALFQTALSGQKARYGDDVSWAAIGTNAAFAAMAGAVIGGAIGGVSKFRHWSVDRPQPVVPEAPSGEATARSEPVRNVSVDQVLSRLETAAARSKSAEVMNDAIHGLVHDGEVKLGEGSQGYITAFHGSPYDFNRFSLDKVGKGEGGQAYGHGLYFAEKEDVAKVYRDDITKTMLAQHRVVASTYPDFIRGKQTIDETIAEARSAGRDNHVATLLEMKELGGAKLLGSMYEVKIKADPDSFLDWDKKFNEQSSNVKSALNELLVADEVFQAWKANGAIDHITGNLLYGRLAGPGGMTRGNVSGRQKASEVAKSKGIVGVKYLDAGSRDAADGSRNYVLFDDTLVSIQSKNGQSFASPAPEPAPAGLAAATVKIDANVKTPADPAKAELDKTIADVQAEGIDPEANTNDLDLDIVSLRNQEAITPEEELALAAADETHAAVKAWEEVMAIARTCVVKS